MHPYNIKFNFIIIIIFRFKITVGNYSFIFKFKTTITDLRFLEPLLVTSFKFKAKNHYHQL